MLEYVDLTGKDFEFLITHPEKLTMDRETFDSLMTPTDIQWTKVQKDGWQFYKVGEDEYSFSWEPPGLQMTFSECFPFEKAQRIAEQIVDKLKKYYQQEFGLEFIPHRRPTKSL